MELRKFNFCVVWYALATKVEADEDSLGEGDFLGCGRQWVDGMLRSNDYVD